MTANDLAASRPMLAAAPPASGVAADPSLHFLGRDDSAEANGIGVIDAFAVVLVLAALVFWVLRRRGLAPRAGEPAWQRLLRSSDAGGLKVLQSTRLTQKASAHVLAWGGERWLVVCNDGTTTVVARQDGATLGDAPDGEST